jgi:hypothetical protein
MQSFVCLSGRSVTPPLQQQQSQKNHMSKRNKGNRPERKLEAKEKQAALYISLSMK